MFPVDLLALFRSSLKDSVRPPDGLLHASMDLVGSLRHTQLRAAGAPTTESEFVREIRLMTGTMWHEWAHRQLVKAGVAFMQEVKLTPYLPPGWGGTADWVFWHPNYKAFVLGDLKTAKGEAMWWLNKDGAKTEHIWQLSAYWHALIEMGLPMVKGFGVLYWPMNEVGDNVVLPTVQECDPLPRDVVEARMLERAAVTKQYVAAVSSQGYLNEHLAPTQERVQKVSWNKKQGVFDVRLVPHWSAAYCQFSPELCSCSTEGTNKIGHYNLDGQYVPRAGWEDEKPAVQPTSGDFTRRRKEALADGEA